MKRTFPRNYSFNLLLTNLKVVSPDKYGKDFIDYASGALVATDNSTKSRIVIRCFLEGLAVDSLYGAFYNSTVESFVKGKRAEDRDFHSDVFMMCLSDRLMVPEMVHYMEEFCGYAIDFLNSRMSARKQYVICRCIISGMAFGQSYSNRFDVLKKYYFMNADEDLKIKSKRFLADVLGLTN